ncbi:hypothetical protein BK004_01390 [bacterium CG10_46_32]|nr:MAG: hypothetical protein BK004_01390 [bacterium CG10_46_32]PIR56351.1 MAG: hypothetical protein COU73_01405 [Parcubacteria group bacterium CG10_big_fil_rev_8_21_14_0_10_46_32]
MPLTAVYVLRNHIYKKKNIIAIIPARGGSKTIPNKNLAPLGGKPLMSYSIAQAQQSRYVDMIVVSSDSEAILAEAKQLGAEAIRRPKQMSGDTSKMDLALRHALLQLDSIKGYVPDYIVLLQPTSPLRSVATIDRAIVAFVDNAKKFDSLIGLCAIESKIGHIKNGRYIALNKMNMQRQQLKHMYQECGTIFVFKPSRILKKQSLYGARVMPFIVEKRHEALDINDSHDMNMANYFLTI